MQGVAGFRLPNGWTITPAGGVVLPDLPLNIIPLADNRHALAATSGYNAHQIALVDLVEKKVVAAEKVNQSWFGLAHDARRDGSGGRAAGQTWFTRFG